MAGEIRRHIVFVLFTIVIVPAAFALPTFTQTGVMGVGCYYHSATLLPDGKVLIAGGSDGSNNFDSAELFDPATRTFTATGSMTTPRANHTATLLPNGEVLIIGGNAGSVLRSAELYDPTTGDRGDLFDTRSQHRHSGQESGRR